MATRRKNPLASFTVNDFRILRMKIARKEEMKTVKSRAALAGFGDACSLCDGAKPCGGALGSVQPGGQPPFASSSGKNSGELVQANSQQNFVRRLLLEPHEKA